MKKEEEAEKARLAELAKKREEETDVPAISLSPRTYSRLPCLLVLSLSSKRMRRESKPHAKLRGRERPRKLLRLIWRSSVYGPVLMN